MPIELRRPNYKLSKLPVNEQLEVKKQRQDAAGEWRLENCWSPNRLRHSRATEIRKKYGLEAVQVVLGHANADVSQVYAERDFGLAARIMGEVG